MKSKTISKVITNKFKEFLNSITDDHVKKLVEKNSLISGGCIASMLLREKVNDFDIYFLNKETALAIATYYVNKYDPIARVVDVDNLNEQDKRFFANRGLSEAGRVGIWGGEVVTNSATGTDMEEIKDAVEVVAEIKAEYKPVYFSPNAISLSDKIQIVLRFYGTADEIHKNYDYVHCTNYWLSNGSELHLNQPALESILAKELIYVGSKYPIASVLRTRKFINRGWTINAGMYLKMCYQVSKLNLDDVAVLEDQLVGVDVAYFSILIEALRKAQEQHEKKGKSLNINYGYLCELIDKIF